MSLGGCVGVFDYFLACAHTCMFPRWCGVFVRYNSHNFCLVILIFVFDGRRSPYKLRNAVSAATSQQAMRDKDSATTYTAMEKALKQLVTIDSDVLHWVKEWIVARDIGGKIKIFGAPFETDAQLVALEREGIVDGIVTDDGECGSGCASRCDAYPITSG